jgi:hypothetical protein
VCAAASTNCLGKRETCLLICCGIIVLSRLPCSCSIPPSQSRTQPGRRDFARFLLSFSCCGFEESALKSSPGDGRARGWTRWHARIPGVNVRPKLAAQVTFGQKFPERHCSLQSFCSEGSRARLCTFKRCKRLAPGVVAVDPVRIGGVLQPSVGARAELDTRRARLARGFKTSKRGLHTVAIGSSETAREHSRVLDPWRRLEPCAASSDGTNLRVV